MNSKELMNKAADNIRILAASMVEKAKSGHPGGAMGGADFINVLFSEFLEYDPRNMKFEGRDRFFLDPGHMVSSWIPATWLPCFTHSWHSPASSQWRSWPHCVSGAHP